MRGFASVGMAEKQKRPPRSAATTNSGALALLASRAEARPLQRMARWTRRYKGCGEIHRLQKGARRWGGGPLCATRRTSLGKFWMRTKGARRKKPGHLSAGRLRSEWRVCLALLYGTAEAVPW